MRMATLTPIVVLAGCASAPAEAPATPDDAPIEVPTIEVEPPEPVASASAVPEAPPPKAKAAKPTKGNMWGDSIGEAFGAGGLGLSGIGQGGGGRAVVGLGSIGTIGHGAGTGTGQGFGTGHGRLGRSWRARPPRVRMGATKVKGKLPPEVIQRIVRQNFGRFRLCYEKSLQKDPKLHGRVQVNFTIGASGKVVRAASGGSMNKQVTDCVTRAFKSMRFPSPDGGGIVEVRYPIVFTPGGSAKKPPPAKAKKKAPPKAPVPAATAP